MAQAGQRPGIRADEVPVKPGKLSVVVIEKGGLEATQTSDVHCKVEGNATIHRIVPGGSMVKKGQTVCQLDTTAFENQLINENIAAQSAEVSFKNARLTREVAELAVVECLNEQQRSGMRRSPTEPSAKPSDR